MELDEKVTGDPGVVGHIDPLGVENQAFSDDVAKVDSDGSPEGSDQNMNRNKSEKILDSDDVLRTKEPATLQVDVAERPATLPMDVRSSYVGNSDLDSMKYKDGMAMSPSYYMLTPDELSLDGSESPRSDHSGATFHPPPSGQFTFDGDLWKKDGGERSNDPFTLVEEKHDIAGRGGNATDEAPSGGNAQSSELTAVSPNTGHPLAIYKQSVEVEINHVGSETAEDKSPRRRVIKVDSKDCHFGAHDTLSRDSSLDYSLDIADPVENGNMVNGAACIRIGDDILESSTDPDVPRTTSFQDVNLTLDRERPSVSYRSNSNSMNQDYYQTDVVMLEEIIPRVFNPAGLKSAQHVATVIPTECHGWTGANINPETMPLQLIQLEVSKDDYTTALTMLGKDVKIAYHTFFYNKWLQIGLFSCVFITLWMLGFLLWHTGGLPDRIGIGLFFILAWMFMVIGLVLCRIARNKMNKKTETTLAQVNEILLKHNVLMGVEDKGAMSCNKVILHFIYFEEGPCMERLMDDIAKGLQKNRKLPKMVKKQRKDVSPEVDIDESDLIIDEQESTEGHRQILAKRLLLKYSGMYVKRLMTERLPRPAERRHTGNIPCLCQFIERHYFKIYEVLVMI